ncbi:MAG: hypothetical protein ACTSWY_10915, partial [Promethearchaeota archaeon]
QYVEINIKKEMDWTKSEQHLETEKKDFRKETIAESEKRVPKPKKKVKRIQAKVIKGRRTATRYYCPECGLRIIPKNDQTFVVCKKCGTEVQITED